MTITSASGAFISVAPPAVGFPTAHETRTQVW
jgi:hypothetical protein